MPEPVRQRVVALASEALDGLSADEVPASLRPFRRFVTARRAHLAASPLAAAVERDAAFRARVAASVRTAVPELAAAVDAGDPPAAADPHDVAALALLLRPDGWEALVERAAGAALEAGERAASAQAQEALARAEEQLAAARAQARADLERVRADAAALKAEVATLRRSLHEARTARREAQDAARAAQEELEVLRRAAAAAQGAADAELRRARARAGELEAALEAARRAGREGRTSADARLRLLLDTLLEAGQGLRRELALPPVAPGAPRPADAVAAQEARAPDGAGVTDVPGRARPEEDPGALEQLLGLPRVHLLVDGYNVTKLGYGGLPLQDQRERLVRGAAALAARHGAEVTVVFDGADVERAPAVRERGVRVLFSRPGRTADELVRRLVAAEPQGRPVVVVSSDREVADGVRARGARPVASAALLRLLGRG
ncbi:RNA-binding protein [Vallicoccus soli]|uniref:RNA-binding protein n=1 Tax=Vallicoccus soli TaxID=2339232 RepID=A0A3A3Z8P2_9ACTN|nr:RNA-binding protein [Vallicoccus soli]